MRVIEPPSHLIPYGHFVRRLYTHLITRLIHPFPYRSPPSAPAGCRERRRKRMRRV